MSEEKEVVECEKEIIEQADDIASSIIKILVDQFEAKEGRKPNSDEIEDLLGEITEDRINEMIYGTEASKNSRDEEKICEESEAGGESGTEDGDTNEKVELIIEDNTPGNKEDIENIKEYGPHNNVSLVATDDSAMAKKTAFFPPIKNHQELLFSLPSQNHQSQPKKHYYEAHTP